jgi:hypothetical protein
MAVGGFLTSAEEENIYEYYEWKPTRTQKHVDILRVRAAMHHFCHCFNRRQEILRAPADTPARRRTSTPSTS